MSDTILRRAHMSAVREMSNLNAKIRRLENALIVAQCLNEYLAARMALHGKPYKMDSAIMSLAQLAMTAPDDDSAKMATESLRQLLIKVQEFTREAIEEARVAPEFEVDDEMTADAIVRRVLEVTDRKLSDYQKSLIKDAGFTKEDLDSLVDEINRRFGRAEDSE